MADEFEKMDESFKKIFGEQKEIFQPEKGMKDFSGEVVKKIMERQRARQIGFGLAAGFCAIAVFGFAMVFVMSGRQEIQVGENPEAVVAVQTPAPLIKENVAPVTEAPRLAVPKQELPAQIQVLAAVPESVTEETIAAEIEALKELGVWTEADEEAIGIPADAMFAEIETYLETEQPAIGMPSQQVAG